MTTKTRPAEMLTHPAVIASLGLLILNDHLLKEQFHNALTGKLSDFAGLLFFPVFVASAVEVGTWLTGRPAPERARLLLVAGSLTAVGFIGIQTFEPMTDLYRSVAGLLTGRPTMVVADPTDLLAVPACFVGWWLYAGLTVSGDKRHGLTGQTDKRQTSVEDLEAGCVG
jgi:hypothetical protein